MSYEAPVITKSIRKPKSSSTKFEETSRQWKEKTIVTFKTFLKINATL